MKLIAHTFMHDFGQMVDWLAIETDGPAPAVTAEDFVLTNCFGDNAGYVPCKGIQDITVEGNRITVNVDPFLFNCKRTFTVECTHPDVAVKITKETLDEVPLFHEELFNAYVENGVTYRLHEPNATQPRPMIVFMHGGGGSGYDNRLQLTDTLGAIKLAERLPDMYVMAPQAPAGNLTMDEAFAKMCAKGDPYKIILGSDPDNDPNDRGWNREYLGRVVDVIRRLIAEGKVDPKRIYCIGMSMGGHGTLKMASAAPDLFASCVVICPSMNGEAWPILANFPDIPLYVATAYIDQHIARHAYIMRAIQALWDKGRHDVRYTIFTPEEMEAYKLGVTKDIPLNDHYMENHSSWVPVLHNEYGILDWMLSHVKK